MSSFALTALAAMSSSSLDATFTSTTSESDETTVRFGDGVSGAELPTESSSALQSTYAAGGGASGNVDSMSEMGEMESLRLQMAMDRLSKLMSTLSNLLHRIETTDAAITRNIK